MMSFSIQPIVSILAGLLIIMIPRALNYIVAIYLILSGTISLLHLGMINQQFQVAKEATGESKGITIRQSPCR